MCAFSISDRSKYSVMYLHNVHSMFFYMILLKKKRKKRLTMRIQLRFVLNKKDIKVIDIKS